MSKECPFPESALELVAQRFALLSEPTRLRILMVLMDGEAKVGAIASELGANHSNISRHLQSLSAAGAVSRRKQGFEVYYHITDPSLFKLCDLVCKSLEKKLSHQAEVLGAQ